MQVEGLASDGEDTISPTCYLLMLIHFVSLCNKLTMNIFFSFSALIFNKILLSCLVTCSLPLKNVIHTYINIFFPGSYNKVSLCKSGLEIIV